MNAIRPHRAFTLVELLIVVSILAVLATIAVPNFLQAQVRSKVARTATDLRTIALGLTAYRVDVNHYPIVPTLEYPLGLRLTPLTTPIAYLVTLPLDPFARHDPRQSVGGDEPFYVLASGNLYAGGDAAFDTRSYHGTLYSLAGRGPDQDIVFGGYCMAHPHAVRGQAPIRGAYDPTNGTISAGDILWIGEGRM
jgi:prepilin-type N-terminal cleavage/methylation domain-containing protein